MDAKAYANNDITVVAWNPGQKLPDCLGFCIERVDLKLGSRTVLPSWVGFANDPDSKPKQLPDGRSQRIRKTTDVWPRTTKSSDICNLLWTTWECSNQLTIRPSNHSHN